MRKIDFSRSEQGTYYLDLLLNQIIHLEFVKKQGFLELSEVDAFQRGFFGKINMFVNPKCKFHRFLCNYSKNSTKNCGRMILLQ